HAIFLVKLGDHALVIIGIHHNRYSSLRRAMIFGGSANHGWPANINVLDGMAKPGIRIGNGLLKWIEVHHQQVNGSNIVVPEGLQVRGVVATGKQAAVYARVQGLDPAIKNFGRSEEQRLNSSHVSISYAVFCLKKKKHKKL